MGIESRAWRGAELPDAIRRSNAVFAAPLPVTERLAASTLGLPFFIDLPDAAAWRIVDALMPTLKEPSLG